MPTVATSGITAVEVVSGLDRPVSLSSTSAEPDRLYVVGQAGVVRVIERGALVREPFLDISALVLTSPKGGFASERGLLSMAFASDYATSGRFFVFYTERSGSDVIVELVARNGRVDHSSAEVLLRIEKQSDRHHGGQLQIGPDGRLHAGIGDDRSFAHSQSLAPGDLKGKLVSVGPDGTWLVRAYGLRNPWRFSFDRETGDLWLGDVGENAYEEVDRIAAGAGLVNLGWPAEEGFHEFTSPDGERVELQGPGDPMPPAVEYSHEVGCSVTGGYVYRGADIPEARGRYFYGDYCTGVVWSVDAARPAEVRRELQLPVTLASFGEGTDGELYLVSRTGRVFRLSRSAG